METFVALVTGVVFLSICYAAGKREGSRKAFGLGFARGRRR
jgi:hypothetical protein